MISFIKIAVLFVNEHNPLGFMFILSALFLFFGTYKHIQLKRFAKNGNKFQHYERLFRVKKKDDVTKFEVSDVIVMLCAV